MFKNAAGNYHNYMNSKVKLMVYLGKKLKMARIRAGFTQEELAETVGVSRGSIARYELGEMEPKLENLVALSKALDISIDYLLGVAKTDQRLVAMLPDEAICALDKFIKAVQRTRDPERKDL